MSHAAVDTTNADYIFKPQAGPQTQFLRSPADIVVYGGAAGSGKTFGVLLEAGRHIETPRATIGIFRRERGRLTNPGGLWDESHKIYTYFGGYANQQSLSWKFSSGAKITMHGVQYDQDVKKFHGSQFFVLIFDELTEFTEQQFWYMLSRNRSDTGKSGYVRATCNPDSNSWVRSLLDWYIGADGYPRAERSGKIRWFARINDVLYWADTKEQLIREHDVQEIDCKSFTFIPATIEDNQILLQNDPRYISNLRALPEVEKQQLLFGNWNIKADGKIFKQKDFMVFVKNPANIVRKIITVDTAQKTKEASDYSVMQCWVKSQNGIYLIDQVRGKFEYPELKMMFIAFATKHLDAKDIYVEDTVSGTALIQECQRDAALKTRIKPIVRSKDKYTRAYDAQGYVKSGYVFVNCVADYYTDFIGEMTTFSADGAHKHDDQVDCMLDAVQKLLVEPTPQISKSVSLGLNSTIY